MNRLQFFFLQILICACLCNGCSPILTRKIQKTPSQIANTPVPVAVTSTPSPLPTVHVVSGAAQFDTHPGEPQGSVQVIHDQTCVSTAQNKMAPGGDEYSSGRFERPFDHEMIYLPALDIIRAELIRPLDGWVYFKIVLQAAPAPSPAVYGIELDNNIDGRGDLLVRISAPDTKEWAESGVKMWWDSDGDVGGQVINRSDPMGNKGSGFESLKINPAANKNGGQVWSRL